MEPEGSAPAQLVAPALPPQPPAPPLLILPLMTLLLLPLPDVAVLLLRGAADSAVTSASKPLKLGVEEVEGSEGAPVPISEGGEGSSRGC